MKVLHALDEAAGQFSRPVVAVGNFDGVHLGHRSIIESAIAIARDYSRPCMAVTFEPHPQSVIGREDTFSVITPLEEKLRLFQPFGIDATLVIPFTKTFAQTEPSDYIRQVYVDRLRITAIAVGYSHAFGRYGAGNIQLLQTEGRRYGFDVRAVLPVHIDGAPVNSSRIRALIQAGRIPDAVRLMGHAYTLTGRVVRGAGRGRQLRFPTANLAFSSPHLLMPKRGVYAVRTQIDGVWLPGVMNIGVRPTFGEERLSCEVHVLDYDGDLYDRDVVVDMIDRLRDEQPFSSVETLRAQIAADVKRARRLLSGAPSLDHRPSVS